VPEIKDRLSSHRKRKVLLVKHYQFNARTVDNDLNILNEEYDVQIYDAKIKKGLGFFTGFLRELLFLTFNGWRFDILFIWFADYHSLLPVFFCKILRRKCVINMGGYDADEIFIGEAKSLKEKFRKYCVKYSVKHAERILAVSNVIRGYVEGAIGKGKCETVYCCIDTSIFAPKAGYHKENIIVTVGGGGEFVKEARRKRLDLFIEIGNNFSERYSHYNAKFWLIGHEKGSKSFEYLLPLIKSKNIELMPFGSAQDLIGYFERASIYMQLSTYEAFGIAQAEAMLFGCIPISHSGGAIAEVVGEAGILVEDFDKEKYIQKIKEVLDGKHEELRAKARTRVKKNFSLEVRRKKLLSILRELVSN